MVEDTAPLGPSQGAARRVPMGWMLRNKQESSNHSEAGVRIAVGNWHQVEREFLLPKERVITPCVRPEQHSRPVSVRLLGRDRHGTKRKRPDSQIQG